MVNQIFDCKIGGLGALVMGSAVYYLNNEYGFDQASIAALKQGTYTFLVGGSMMKLSENIATLPYTKNLIKLAAVAIPSTLTISLTYLVHSLKGTPEPFESTIPTIVAAPIGFAWWANKKKKELDNTYN